MADASPNFFDYDFTKVMADFRFRPLDVEAVWAAQRRNIEAFNQANQVAAEGVHAVTRRQIEAAREAFEEFSTFLRDLAQPVSAEDRIARNTDYAKKMIEKGISHSREITSIAGKAGTDAADVLRKRAAEGLDEFRSLTCPQAAR